MYSFFLTDDRVMVRHTLENGSIVAFKVSDRIVAVFPGLRVGND